MSLGHQVKQFNKSTEISACSLVEKSMMELEIWSHPDTGVEQTDDNNKRETEKGIVRGLRCR